MKLGIKEVGEEKPQKKEKPEPPVKKVVEKSVPKIKAEKPAKISATPKIKADK